ncbi:MAG: tRNA 2-thiouridine(34) synthase MnmA [Bacteroidota bacterium]|nr:tRNA 2-thiouridine(34) synthase MnmA [Candidatus Kapabacteria bacterium]MDW8221265.1 tRNA 2-thiouridine(34) synthase MnmA [Bacteroidota bacterium]
MKRNSKRVIVGMSGGVDSAVAAALLVEQGYEVIGITIKTYNYDDVGGNVGNESSCCSLDGINDARRVCMMLDIPHYTVDFTDKFKAAVIDYFIDTYMSGQTPNPCVQCNRHIKWSEMLRKADALGAEYIAMGHYAYVRYNEATSRYYIARGTDTHKDQSYALWALRQESLARTMFPLASLTKEQVRAEAARLGLPIAAKQESYEICFVPDNNYRRFLRDTVSDFDQRMRGGKLVLDGAVIGEHQGFAYYTIGQRKGLGISSPEPLYVLNVIPETNTVVVGRDCDLLAEGLQAHSLNMMKYEHMHDERICTVKIRYKDEGEDALCQTQNDGKLIVRFCKPRRAVTPGQSVVLYEGNDVVGGGIIAGAL